MERGLRAWTILLLGLIFVVAGAQGVFGSLLGSLITPQYMVDKTQSQNAINSVLPPWAQNLPIGFGQ